MKKLLFILLLTSLFSTICLAQQADKLQLVENKGQWDENVTFKGDLVAGALFLTKKGFTVVQHNHADLQRVSEVQHGTATAEDQDVVLQSHAYEMKFLHASDAIIIREERVNSYNNYFLGNDPAKWFSGCEIFQSITYTNVYPGIDAKYYTANGKVKYDLIIHPGADITKIAMEYKGADAIAISNEELVIKTSVGDIKEMAPYAYQQQNGRIVQVDCKFRLEGNIVSFETGSYDASKTLVIDPTLVFSTFTGSSADNWGYTATYGPDGSAFAAGIVFGTGYPVTPGAYQTSFAGGPMENNLSGFDVGIIKLNATGTQRIYATYLGGSGNEFPQSIVTDTQGELVISGSTSSSNFPATGAVIGTGGGHDIFITRINAAGTALIGSRRIGGSQRDGINIQQRNEAPLGVQSIRRNYGDDSRSEVLIDGSNNIILASSTQSSDFPVTSLQTSFGGGLQDGILIKMSPDLGALIFSTFFGGNGDDALFAATISPATGLLYVVGSTTSSSGLPGNKTGVISSNFVGGVSDGFLSLIDPLGLTISKTTYLGTAGNDMVYGIKTDNAGFPYVTGTTTGNWPVQNAAFSQAGGKQFIAMLQPDLSAYVYSTVFGTNSTTPNLSTAGFMVDGCENVYVSGWGGSINQLTGYPTAGTTGLTVTPNAIQTSTDGSDFYFFVLQKNAASQLYGSFFGQAGGAGDHVDGGTSRFDPLGTLYQAVCANCGGGAVFPTTPGSWAPTNGSPNCNQAVVKISFDFCSTPVPVHLVSFSGKVINQLHQLTWKVLTEEKGDRYIVETAGSPAGPFTKAYAVTAINSTNSNTYNATITAGMFTEKYYRLKIVSANQAANYSRIIRLTANKSKRIDAIVSGNVLHVRMPADALHTSVYTTEGKLLVHQPTTGAGYSLIQLPSVAKGMLVIKVQMKDEVLVKKIAF